MGAYLEVALEDGDTALIAATLSDIARASTKLYRRTVGRNSPSCSE